ncbi:DUF5590 domain-containing protein [Cohnella faecalis]|uniref:Cell wall elongation regulator TseB-like domain-containing protein n=1 Tax=Cohnella faecalis TaxID=2315694 RepID=A0A398CQ83_9BACL|nr:DUF5590 domain-containing protein [Cohnella faecalis]RIE04685.1 hypothetical protein D3H35_04150 [Cohnella faecalis]
MRASRRTEHNRAPRAMTAGKWVFVIVCFIVFLIVSFVVYIRSSESEYRKDERTAIRIAREQGGLKKIDEALPYTWEESMWIVRGEDERDQIWYVWERKDGIVKKLESEGLSEQQAKQRFSDEYGGDVSPVRIIPAWFDGQPAWEVRYESRTQAGHQAIDFYSFENGAKLKTYELPGTSND